MRGTLFVCAAALLFGCGGAEDSPLFDGGGGSTGDGGGTSDVIMTPDMGGGNCDVSKCATIPSGFHAVRLNDGNTACPGSWTSTSVVTSPVAADGACTCQCNVTQDPGCGSGQIFRFLDDTTSPTCGTQATTFTANNGGCSQIGAQLLLNHAHYEVDAPPAAGGACQYDAKLDQGKVSGTPALVCQPPATCVGAICDGGAVCVASDGDVDCPSGFPTKTLVGGSATATCGACGATCLATGTCTGTISFFTDQQCTLGKVDFTADGQCKPNVAVTTTAYFSYSYTGSLQSSTCSGTPPPSTATASLDKPVTVCCK